MGVIIPKLRQSAKGQPCTFETEFCNHDPATTVLAHLPSHVKGMGNKSDDWHAAFACSACHDALDQRRIRPIESMWFYCHRALQRTHKIWRDMGLIQIAGDTEKPRKPSKKTVQRSSLYQLQQPGLGKGD